MGWGSEGMRERERRGTGRRRRLAEARRRQWEIGG